MFIDEETRQRVQTMPHIGDIVYEREGDSAVSDETVSVIGNWSDYTGSGIVDTKTLMYGVGVANELFGSDPSITDDAKVPNLNIVGQPSDSTRRRVIKKYKDLNGTKS